jgi:CubicO group peptidase (beta-lactamase class C family)
MDTPFNVGSVSKTMLAMGIMQQVEQGNIGLDDKITEMNLIFDPNNPLNKAPNNGITLRHLVTHTSGIKDSEGYNCSYYLHDNNASLYQMFGVDSCPADATSDPTTFYATDYFNADGRYVMEGIYNDGEYGFPGMVHQYSNVGAGLAAYSIEQKLDIDFAQTMQQNIFLPLNMNNTAWRHTELSEDNPKATQYALNEDLEPIEMPEFSYPTFYDGDLNISANDLAKYLITIVNGGEYQGTRILKEETVKAMLSAQTDVFSMFDTQGVFWHTKGSYIGHNGGDPGTNAIMKYNVETKTGVVILMNGEDDELGEGNVDEMLAPLVSLLYRYGLGQ